jgi:hypothetical protein
LASFSRDAAGNVEQPVSERRAAAQNLANSFESIASMIVAGALKSAADIIAATRANNNTALGTAKRSWEPWAESLRVKLNALSESGQLVEPADYAAAWREIAIGLRAVK